MTRKVFAVAAVCLSTVRRHKPHQRDGGDYEGSDRQGAPQRRASGGAGLRRDTRVGDSRASPAPLADGVRERRGRDRARLRHVRRGRLCGRRGAERSRCGQEGRHEDLRVGSVRHLGSGAAGREDHRAAGRSGRRCDGAGSEGRAPVHGSLAARDGRYRHRADRHRIHTPAPRARERQLVVSPSLDVRPAPAGRTSLKEGPRVMSAPVEAGSEAVAPGTSGFSVTFVCTGNRARSPVAQELLRRLVTGRDVSVDSYGTLDLGPVAALPEADAAARRLGVELGGHRARALRPGVLGDVDLVVGFEPTHVATAVVDAGARRERCFTILELVELLEAVPPHGFGSPEAVVAQAHARRSGSPLSRTVGRGSTRKTRGRDPGNGRDGRPARLRHRAGRLRRGGRRPRDGAEAGVGFGFVGRLRSG